MFISPRRAMTQEQYALFQKCFQSFRMELYRLANHIVAAKGDNNPLRITEEDFGCPVSKHNIQHVFFTNVEYPKRTEEEKKQGKNAQLLPVVMLVKRIMIPFRTETWCYPDTRKPSSCRFCNSEGFAWAFDTKHFSLLINPEEGKFQFEPYPYQCLLPCPYCEAGTKIDSVWKLNDSGVYDRSRIPVPTVVEMLHSDAGRQDSGEMREAA